MQHTYTLTLEWTGNKGRGTSGYRDYSRDHVVRMPGKPDLAGSSDPAFLGNDARWSPEDLLLASLAACHQLWFLHLCAEAGVVVTAYLDQPVATMRIRTDGSGEFKTVELRPTVTFDATIEQSRVNQLHHAAHEKCFIARSMNFPVTIAPQ